MLRLQFKYVLLQYDLIWQSEMSHAVEALCGGIAYVGGLAQVSHCSKSTSFNCGEKGETTWPQNI